MFRLSRVEHPRQLSYNKSKTADITVLDLSPLQARWASKEFWPLETVVSFHDLVVLSFIHTESVELWQLIDQSEEVILPVDILNKIDDQFQQFLQHIDKVYVPDLPGGKDMHQPTRVTDRDIYFERVP